MKIFLSCFLSFLISFNVLALEELSENELKNLKTPSLTCKSLDHCIMTLSSLIHSEWKPDIQYFERKLTTRVRVFMSDEFVVERVEIISSSGDEVFDGYATKAVQPFLGSDIFNVLFTTSLKKRMTKFVLEFSTRNTIQ